MSAHLERLVTDWRDAIVAIDDMKKRRVTQEEIAAAISLLAVAQARLLDYAKEMG